MRHRTNSTPGSIRFQRRVSWTSLSSGRANAGTPPPAGFPASPPRHQSVTFLSILSPDTRLLGGFFVSLTGVLSLAQDVACSAVIAAVGRIEWAGVPGSFYVPSLCAAPCGRWGVAASVVVNGQVRTCPGMTKPGPCGPGVLVSCYRKYPIVSC